MATYNVIPNAEGKIRQVNKGEIYGELFSSWNLDLQTNRGKIRLSPRLKTLTTSDDDAELGLPIRFLFFRGVWWTYAGDRMYKNDGTATGAFTVDAISGTPTNLLNSFQGDAVLFNGAMIVSHQTGMYRCPSAGNWTSNDWWSNASNLNQAALDSSFPHPMEVSKIGSELLLVGDGNKIHTVTTGSVVTNPRLTLDPNVYVTWIKSGSTRVWIGTAHKSGGEGLVYEWDGGNTLTNRAYRIGATGTYAGIIKGDNIIIVTSDGSIKEYGNGKFNTIAQFPVKDKGQLFKYASDFTATNFGYNSFIHPRGINLVDDVIMMNVSNELIDASYNIPEAMPCGIWQLDEDNGLYHRYSPQIDDDATTGFGTIAHIVTGVTGDKGSSVGAIQETKQVGSQFFAGFRTYKDNGSNLLSAICTVDERTLATRGRFVTPFLYPRQIKSIFQNISSIFETSGTTSDNDASEKIIFKYRQYKKKGLPLVASVTWSSSTQFTSTNTGFANVAIGDEVTVLLGNGHGCIEQITNITENAGTYTVTLANQITNVSASDTGKVRVENWKPLTTISDAGGLQNFFKSAIPSVGGSSKIQLSIEIRSAGGFTPEIDKVLLELKETQ